MPSIGAVGCDFVKGNVPSRKLRTVVWETPGIHGYGAQTTGLGDAPFKVTAVQYGSKSTLDTWATALCAVQGTVVTIVNDNYSFDRCLVTTVSAPDLRAAYGDGPYRAEVTIEGVRT